MRKFENVDILACLDAVMKQNTGFYQSDFEIDKEIIHKAAASPDREDRTLLWLSRPSGTHCFRERDVFLKDTRPYNTWKFHGEQTRDRILAYAVELTGRERGKIRGNLYELDYAAHFRHVREQALPADTNALSGFCSGCWGCTDVSFRQQCAALRLQSARRARRRYAP